MVIQVIRDINFLSLLINMQSTVTLDLIYMDVWTSPTYFVDGYKYCVVFVDHYTFYV